MAVFTRVKTWVSNEVLTAVDLNGEFNNLLNNTIPGSIEDYSSNVPEMQSTTDPGGVGTESQATTLAGELQRLRFAIKRMAGGAQWYSTPARTLGALNLQTSDFPDGSVTTPKIADANVTTDKIADANVTTPKIADGAITAPKLATGAIVGNIANESIGLEKLTVYPPVVSAFQNNPSVGGAALSWVDVPGFTVTVTVSEVTTQARPIRVEFFDGQVTVLAGTVNFRILRNGGVFYDINFTGGNTYDATPASIPIDVFGKTDWVGNGTYVYKVQYFVATQPSPGHQSTTASLTGYLRAYKA